MTRLPAALLALALVAILPSAAIADPTADASKSCSVGNSRSYGTTYVLSISVRNVSCRTGRSVIRAFHACRPGKAGHCSRASGYSCSERRFNKSPQSYDSRVTCTKGTKVVKHTYTQFI
jgi:hypothetical protein